MILLGFFSCFSVWFLLFSFLISFAGIVYFGKF